MKLTLVNGTVLNPISANGFSKYSQGANRDILEFAFPVTEDLNELDSLFSAENCEKLVITEEAIAEGETTVTDYIHVGYTLRDSLRKEHVYVAPAKPDEEATYADRIIVAMGQRTFAETQIRNLLVSQADQDEVIAELMFGEEE